MKQIPFKQGDRITEELDSILKDIVKIQDRLMDLYNKVNENTHVPKWLKKMEPYLHAEEDAEEKTTADNSCNNENSMAGLGGLFN